MKNTANYYSKGTLLIGLIFLMGFIGSCKKDNPEPTPVEPQTSASEKISGFYIGDGSDTTGAVYSNKNVEVSILDNDNNVLISPIGHTGFEPFSVKVYETNLNGNPFTVSAIADTNFIVVLDISVDPYVLYFEGNNATNDQMTFSGTKQE